jgi:penicillin-binding protein 2
MSGTTTRLWRLGAVYAVLLLAVGVHLGGVMLAAHEDWLVRSYRNRWAFRDVPSVRGALLDRFGRVLASDEPTFELGCVYEHFRLLHPVGAAIHGATLATRLCGSEVRYGYCGGALGPEQAARDLLGLRTGQLLHADLPKDERRELLASVVTVLAAAGDRTRALALRQLRECAATAPDRPVAAALPDLTADQVFDGFAAIHARLQALDRALRELEAQCRAATGAGGGADADLDDDADDAAAVAGTAARPQGLLQRLDRFRVDCLEERRTRARAADGSVHDGELLERLARPVARRLPFALAAALRVAATDQPGLRLEPALLRKRPEELPPTLRQLLGGVRVLDETADARRYVDDRVEQTLAPGLEDLVPDDLSASPEYRQELMQQAQRDYERVLRTRERRGTGGIESMLDDALAGAPGLRLVERDARAREQLLWSSLRVEPGADVALSIDLDLQRLLDREVARAVDHWRRIAAQPERIDVAMTLLDAATGDVLALAGAPEQIDGKPRLPAVLSWRGNGALGSIVKPFLLLEQLRATRQGLPHADLEHFEPCAMKWRGPDRRIYNCDSRHEERGRDPVFALRESCNVFFFQLAEGLQEDGLRRGLWRFGLLPPPDGQADDGRFHERPAELPAALAAAPRWSGRQALPMRGIGYGIEANPLAVAGAYAALATGRLPTVGLRRGEARPSYDLDSTDDELAMVRAGLQQCVTEGTAKRVTGLREFHVLGKTGTAEVVHEAQSTKGVNNAWFAGYLPTIAQGGTQLVFCAVVYGVPQGVHGADAAGMFVAEVLAAMATDATLAQRYLQPGSGR